jgi:hypothetical protein
MGTHAAWAALGALATWLALKIRKSQAYAYYRERVALRKLLDLRRDRRVLIVLPRREQPREQRHLGMVAYEDMLACSLIERSLILAGWPEDCIEIVSHTLVDNNSPLRRENLVLLCSPRRNPITEEVLHNLKNAGRLDCRFEPGPGNSAELVLKLNGQTVESPSYREEEALLARHKTPYDGTLNDRALIAKFINPWQTDRKILLVAGLRAIGTWGAARALRQRAAELLMATKGTDFAVVVDCKYEQWRIIEYDPRVPVEVKPP